MNEQENLIQSWEALQKRKIRSALATITQVSGSSYRRPGAKMLIAETGEIFGQLSGGCLERDLIRRGVQTIQKGSRRVVVYDTSQDASDSEEEAFIRSAGLGCEGRIDILIDPNPASTLLALVRVREARTLAVCISPLTESESFQFWVDSNGITEGVLPLEEYRKELTPQIAACFISKKSIVVQSSGKPVFFDVLAPSPELFIFGAGHDAVALLGAASLQGYRTTVVDTRSAFPLPKRHFALADQFVVSPPHLAIRSLSIGVDACAILMTHNQEHDQVLLESLIKLELQYIGLLGPRSRGEKILNTLGNAGSIPSESARERIFSPVGLDIGAEGPTAIALSILAEIQAVRAKRKAGFLRNRPSPIHGRL